MLKYIAAILFTNAIGIIGSIFTADKIDTWYQTLEKPFSQPPNWLFGPVWVLLYTCLGIVLVRLWQAQKNKYRKKALGWFIVQMVLNALWTPIFFGAEAIGIGFGIISLLIVSIGMTMYYLYRLDRVSCYLLVPYLLWVVYATLLNGAIWWLN